VNYRERHVKALRESNGWKVLRGGAPDFVCIKVDESGKITAVEFTEVKSPDDQLSYEQAVWREIAVFLGVPWKTEVIV
jgi:hypothetical protein